MFAFESYEEYKRSQEEEIEQYYKQTSHLACYMLEHYKGFSVGCAIIGIFIGMVISSRSDNLLVDAIFMAVFGYTGLGVYNNIHKILVGRYGICPNPPIDMSEDEFLKMKKDYMEKCEQARKERELQEKINPHGLDVCTSCGEFISPYAERCPHCGGVTGVHICPKCHSRNTVIISDTHKAVSAAVLGYRGNPTLWKEFRCKDCGHRF